MSLYKFTPLLLNLKLLELLKILGFTYCKSMQVRKSVKLPSNAPGCGCEGTCVDPKRCACARLNGSDFPYVHRDGGR